MGRVDDGEEGNGRSGGIAGVEVDVRVFDGIFWKCWMGG